MIYKFLMRKVLILSENFLKHCTIHHSNSLTILLSLICADR